MPRGPGPRPLTEHPALADLPRLDPQRPVLIAGPTGSGKSGLALRIAEDQGGCVINADALQVFAGWPVLTAQPGEEECRRVPHRLYGHIPCDADYSVGAWLRDLTPLLTGGPRPIIVGGTGLYLTALTEGLAQIPATPPEVRANADALTLPELLTALDAETRAGLDTANRARVQRAWEVQRATGQSLRRWQAKPATPLLPLTAAQPLLLDAPKDWLTPRLARRFDQMLTTGALAEARAMRPNWNARHLSSRAIGAADLIAHLEGTLPLDAVRDRAVIATRQYAKRQRSWFRARMAGWPRIDATRL